MPDVLALGVAAEDDEDEGEPDDGGEDGCCLECCCHAAVPRMWRRAMLGISSCISLSMGCAQVGRVA